MLVLLPTVRLVHYIYFDRSSLPDLERFIRFEIPTIGHVYDAQGTVLIELAREYRRVISFDEVPAVLRDAILAAEDRNFFAHSGVEYRALPRVAYKTIVHPWPRGGTADVIWLHFRTGLHAHPAARPRLLPPGPF
jgi:penicillin-binding protein 1A